MTVRWRPMTGLPVPVPGVRVRVKLNIGACGPYAHIVADFEPPGTDDGLELLVSGSAPVPNHAAGKFTAVTSASSPDASVSSMPGQAPAKRGVVAAQSA